LGTLKFILPIVENDDFGDGEVVMGRFEKEIILPPYKTIP